MKIALINYVYSADCSDPDDLLARYATLRCWAEALLAAGASEVATDAMRGAQFLRRRASCGCRSWISLKARSRLGPVMNGNTAFAAEYF